MRYNDPTGHCPLCLTAAIGGAIGGIAGAVGYTAYIAATGREFNSSHFWITTGGGAVAGALIGTGVGWAAGVSTVGSTTAAVTAGGVAEATNTACGGDLCAGEVQQVEQTVQETGPVLAQTLGKMGEESAGIIKNTLRIPSLTNTASYRIPDQLLPDQGLLSEVKNVSQLSLTNQLRDFLAYAKQNDLVFELWTRETTKLSAPLQELIDKGEIIQRILKK